MPENPTTIQGTGAEVAIALSNWIREEMERGIALFALEGLMASGKTTTAIQARRSLSTLVHVKLDDFFDPRGAKRRRTWEDALMHQDAIHHIKAMMRPGYPVLVDGAIAWPTVEACDCPSRRIYLKRMQFPDFWADEGDLTEFLNRQVFRKSIRDYHARQRPWTVADLVLERVVGPDGE